MSRRGHPSRLIVLLVQPLCLAACWAGQRPPLGKKALVAELTRLVRSPELLRARVGVAVCDLVERRWLFLYQADSPYAVASNAKLATTAAALELLGPGYQFRTTVAHTGKVQGDGVLVGDLVVIGRGDPSISGRFHDGNPTAVLAQWADAVKAAGIREVRGDIIADETYFDRRHTHPDWPKGQHAAWYCAPVSALSFNDNCVLVVVRPSEKNGEAARVEVVPPTGYVRLFNRCRTIRSRNGRVVVHRPAGKNDIYVGGGIPRKGPPFSVWVTVHEPALYTATVFREVLAARGVKVTGRVRLKTPTVRFGPGRLREIITTTSGLREAVEVANARSQNFYAGQIFKTLGREKAGEGSFAAGARVVEAFLRGAGVKGPVALADGSGLARTNRLSPMQIVTLLAYMNCRRTGSIFVRSLARPGEPGTLANRLLQLKGKLFAKTGYIVGACSLSGYLEAANDRLLAFSILVNDFRIPLWRVRAFQDAICLVLSRYSGEP